MIGEIQWLNFKTKRVREREEAEYNKFAFPYGDPQKEKVMEILRRLVPKMDDVTLLISFLTCKELYFDAYTGENYDEAIKITKKSMHRYRRFVTKKYAPIYLALAIIDLSISDQLDYPPDEEIIERSKEFVDVDIVKK